LGQIALVALNRIKFSTYILAIQEYKGRVLTNQSDSVNAILGVLRTLSEQWGAFHSGMPESHLASALLWGPPKYGTVKKYLATDAPFPSWSWARWSFPQVITWQPPKPSKARLSNQAYLVQPSGITALSSSKLDPLRASWHDSKPPKQMDYRYLSTKAQRDVDTIGELICMECSVVKVRIGELWQEWLGPSHPSGRTIMEYCLKHPKSDATMGYIRMSSDEKKTYEDGEHELISVCWVTGYDGPSIPSKFIPTKQVNKGDSENPNWVTVNRTPDECPTASVFLVRWKNEIAESVALGHVVGSLWNICDRREKWILFG